MHQAQAKQTPGLSDPVAVEACRLDALASYDILDTPREEAFDRIARLIRNIFEVPYAIVSAMDAHRQWYKANVGLDISEVARKDTFCRHIITDPRVMVVPDARLDARFAGNPFVTGEPHIRFYAGVPLTSREGHAIGTVCAMDVRPRSFDAGQTEILTDLARIAMDALELRRAATTDPLTGLLSRQAFMERGTAMVESAQARGAALSCVILDIDHFKLVNDSYGHAAGDNVLAGVVSTCRSCLPQPDLFGRLGGEEFALLLESTDRRAGMHVAERLRMAIDGLGFHLAGARRRITASFGVSSLDHTTRDLTAMLANADAALYKAKSSGRNRTICFVPPETSTSLGARRRVLKAGQILFNNRMSTVDCTVRSIGVDGADLAVVTPAGIPERFVLLVRSDNLETNCRIVAQEDRRISVEFC